MLSAEQDSPTAGRPLVNLSFALNYATAGLDVRAYHATNLLIHILCAALMFAVVRRTLRLPAFGAVSDPTSTHLAFAAALIWAVHPLNSEVVEARHAAHGVDDGALISGDALRERARAWREAAGTLARHRRDVLRAWYGV